MDFNVELKNKISYTDSKLDYFMPKENQYPEIISKSMRYSVFAGGKRLRPILLISACEALGGDREKAAPFACAIEMIHTYSLIHDDLPAMDNDDYRRGMPTNHKAFGENIAILAGDALLNHSFEIMTEASYNSNDFKCVEAMRAIGKASGIRGMIGGQVIDVISDGKKINAKTLEFIHKNKTAAMIVGALTAGGILGGANETQVNRLAEAGERIGIAFQIQDDILDVTSTKEVLGKNVKSDEKNEKTTYVTMYGLEKSKEFVEQLSSEAVEILEQFSKNDRFLIDLTRYLIKRYY